MKRGENKKGKKKIQQGESSNLSLVNPYIDSSGNKITSRQPHEVIYHPIQDIQILNREEIYGTEEDQQDYVQKDEQIDEEGNKEKKRTSPVWNYFTIEKKQYEDGNYYDAAVCTLCNAYYFTRKSSLLKTHLNSNEHKNNPKIDFNELNKPRRIKKNKILRNDQQWETSNRGLKLEKTEEEKEEEKNRVYVKTL